MLQQGTLGALLGTADHFFAGHAQLIARQGGKAGREAGARARRGPYLGARQTHWQTQGLQVLPPTPYRYDGSAP